MDKLLASALPTHPSPLLCITRDIDRTAAILKPLLGDADVITYVPFDAPFDLDQVANDGKEYSVIMLDGLLRDHLGSELLKLLTLCHGLLGDRGRLLIADRLVPFDRVAAGSGRKLLGWFGVRYTSADVFSLLESAGFWDCLVLRKGGLDSDVVIRGDKVVQRAALDEHPTLQTNPTFRLVKK